MKNNQSIENILSNPDYQTDSQTLSRRAFRIQQKLVGLLMQLYVLITTPPNPETSGPLRTIKDWLLVPFTLWPIDFAGLGRFVSREVEQGKPLDPAMAALLHLVKGVPGEQEQEAIGEYERFVALGDYDHLVRDDAKYQVREKELLNNPEFHADVKLLDDLFDLASWANDAGIIRRTMVCERNFRNLDFRFNWGTEESRFQILFDAFCWKYDLYGLEYKKPLLMQVTVNPTPHGLIIYIPRWMNLDIRRDLVQTAITKLQKARGTVKQGPKISETRFEKQNLAKRVYLADRNAKQMKLEGEPRRQYIIKEAGLSPRTDMRRIRALIELGRKLLTNEPVQPKLQPSTTLTE